MSPIRKLFGSQNPPTLWAFAIAAVLLYLYSLTQLSTSDIDGYWTGVVSTATVFTVFSCGFAAVAASVEGSRVRRARLPELAPARSPLAIAARGCAPVIVLAIVLQTFGFVLTANSTWGAPGQVPWAIFVTWLTMIAFHTGIGYLIGLYVPFAAAPPLALIVSYVWLGFTWSVAFVPLRYLSGLAISGCCAPYAELAPAAPWATTIFSVFGIGAVITVLAQRSGVARTAAWKRAAPLPLIASGAALGIFVAAGLGPYPSPPRDSTDLLCEQTSATEVCLYPEQLWAASPAPVPLIGGALEQLGRAGFAVPGKVTGELNQGVDGTDTVSLAYRRDFGRDMILRSVSSAITQPELIPNCEYSADEGEVSPHEYSRVAAAVLYVNAGGAVDSPLGAEVVRGAERLLALDTAAQAEWVARVIPATHSCGDLPPL